MFKYVRYGLLILGLLLPAIIQAQPIIQAQKVGVTQPCSSSHVNKSGLRVCDVTLTAPSFTSTQCTATTQTGIYTLTNNTPVTLIINYIRIVSSDAFPPPPSTTPIVPAPTKNCGTSLAAGDFCNIAVSLIPLQYGTFNRVLQVGIDSRQVQVSAPAITTAVFCGPPSPPVPVTVSDSFLCALGTTSTFATLAGSTITSTGATLLNGNLGLSPGTSVTGFPPGVVNGIQHITDGVAAAAQVDLTTLYTCLAAQTCPLGPVHTIETTNQAGVTLSSDFPGAQTVFCSGSTININNGTLTLSGNANSVFIFQAGSGLNLSNANIVLTGGVKAANVFWQVGSSAVLGPNVTFDGTIAALSSISLGLGDTISGRALARNAAVTFIGNTVTVP